MTGELQDYVTEFIGRSGAKVVLSFIERELVLLHTNTGLYIFDPNLANLVSVDLDGRLKNAKVRRMFGFDKQLHMVIEKLQPAPLMNARTPKVKSIYEKYVWGTLCDNDQLLSCSSCACVSTVGSSHGFNMATGVFTFVSCPKNGGSEIVLPDSTTMNHWKMAFVLQTRRETHFVGERTIMTVNRFRDNARERFDRIQDALTPEIQTEWPCSFNMMYPSSACLLNDNTVLAVCRRVLHQKQDGHDWSEMLPLPHQDNFDVVFALHGRLFVVGHQHHRSQGNVWTLTTDEAGEDQWKKRMVVEQFTNVAAFAVFTTIEDDTKNINIQLQPGWTKHKFA